MRACGPEAIIGCRVGQKLPQRIGEGRTFPWNDQTRPSRWIGSPMNNRGRDPMHGARRFLHILHSDDVANAAHRLARLPQEHPACRRTFRRTCTREGPTSCRHNAPQTGVLKQEKPAPAMKCEFANPLHEWRPYRDHLIAFARSCRVIGAAETITLRLLSGFLSSHGVHRSLDGSSDLASRDGCFRSTGTFDNLVGKVCGNHSQWRSHEVCCYSVWHWREDIRLVR